MPEINSVDPYEYESMSVIKAWERIEQKWVEDMGVSSAKYDHAWVSNQVSNCTIGEMVKIGFLKAGDTVDIVPEWWNEAVEHMDTYLTFEYEEFRCKALYPQMIHSLVELYQSQNGLPVGYTTSPKMAKAIELTADYRKAKSDKILPYQEIRKFWEDEILKLGWESLDHYFKALQLFEGKV